MPQPGDGSMESRNCSSVCHPSLEAAALWRLCRRGVLEIGEVRMLVQVTRAEALCLQKLFGTLTASRTVQYRREVLQHFDVLTRRYDGQRKKISAVSNGRSRDSVRLEVGA